MNGADVVTAVDMLEFQAKLEQQAARIARVGEVDSCTYVKGYVSQPVYSCATCNPPGKEKAGFCFGCSMTCHVDHEVIELFEKRHFRCDCGNAHSGQSQCHLQPLKEDVNSQNCYSQNFEGLYCYCAGPYNEDTDEMFACFVCQDWFHSRCIGPSCIEQSDDSEYLCQLCLQDPSKAILTSYLDMVSSRNATPLSPSSQSSASSEPSTPSSSSLALDSSVNTSVSSDSPAVILPSSPFTLGKTTRDLDTSTTPSSKRQRVGEEKDTNQEEKECTRPTIQAQYDNNGSRGVFLPVEWRSRICRCKVCSEDYRRNGLGFLVDDEERCNVGVLEAGDDEEDEDASNPSSETSTTTLSTEELAGRALGNLPRSHTMSAAVQMRGWADRIKAQLAEFHVNNPNEVITKEVMERIILEVSNKA